MAEKVAVEKEGANDEGTYRRALEQYIELGHEYRYRDILMVQEFGLSMVALGALIGGLVGTGSVTGFGRDVMLLFATAFVAILALHLRNTNQDRVRTLEVRSELAKVLLKFELTHMNTRGTLRLSAPLQMFRFTVVLTLALLCWTAISMSFDVIEIAARY